MALSAEIFDFIKKLPFKLVPEFNHAIAHVVLEMNGDNALLFRGGTTAPYIAAYGYDTQTGTWSQGHYFSDKVAAGEYYNKHYGPKVDVCELTYDELSSAQKSDVLDAYDAYIYTAFDAGLPKTGWSPVCAAEFFESEYKNVWVPAEDKESAFEYMWENSSSEWSINETIDDMAMSAMFFEADTSTPTHDSKEDIAR